MKLKKIILIVIIIAVLIGLWFLGYNAMKNNHKENYSKAVLNRAVEYIMSDTYFAEQYGAVESVSLYPNEQVIIVESHKNHIPCLVVVENGSSYKVWVEHSFSAEEEPFSYMSIDAVNLKKSTLCLIIFLTEVTYA